MSQPMPARLRAVIAALWTGNLFAPFLVSGVAAMLPAMGLSLGGSAVALSLVMACYNLGQGISHILSGRICGFFGVKKVLLAGVALFCLFGVLLGLSQNMPFAIGLRFAQGLAAASISCCVTALSVSLAPPERRGQVISTVVTAVYLGLAVGPVVCGGLTDLWGWRTVFFILALFGAVELWLLHRIIPQDEKPVRGRSFDIAGALLVSLSLSLITFGATCAFLHPAVSALLPSGLILLTVFLRREWRSENPILELRLLARVPDLPGGMVATFINYGAIMGLSLFYSLYLQQVLGLNAFHTGLVVMTQSLVQAVLSPVAGRLADRFDAVRVSTMGMGICGAGMLALLLLGLESSVWQVMLNMAVIGTGIAFFVAPNVAATLGNVPKDQMPIASGLLGCMRTLGGLLSHILMASVIGFYMGEAVVGPDNAELFLSATRCVLLIFAVFNFLAMGLGVRRSAGHRAH